MKSKFKFIKGKVGDSWNFLKDSKKYIYFMAFVFLFGGIIGFAFSNRFGFLDEILRNIVEQVRGKGPIDLMFFIFQNNAKSAFFGLVLGVIFGIFPLINSLGNGVILGYVLSITWQISGIKEFWRLLPHGIFELPAIFISLGLGLRIGMAIFSKKGRANFNETFKKSLWIFLLIVIPLLVLAAIIEGALIVFFK